MGAHSADLELARLCAEGDEHAWERFVREYRPLLYRAADALDRTHGAREIADSLYAELYGVNGRTATLVNTPTLGVPGPLSHDSGKGMTFTAANSEYATVPHNAAKVEQEGVSHPTGDGVPVPEAAEAVARVEVVVLDPPGR